MVEKADIKEDVYQRRVRDLISRILQAAFKSKDLKTFLDEIVEVGAEKTEAKSCDIFLLEESEEGEGRRLRAYATSGEVGETLKEKGAWYYVPKREPFKDEGEGKKKVIAYLRKYFLKKRNLSKEALQKREQDLEKEGKSLMDVLREERMSIMDVINEMEDKLTDLLEDEELPMGITAYVVRTEEPIPPLHGNEVREHPEWRGSYEGAHEICTSLIDVPLKTDEGKVLGMIKIENHKKSDSIRDFKDLNESTIYYFTEKHKEILTILADSALIAIKNILYRADTYKKIFGTEILRKIDALQIGNSDVNKEIHVKWIKNFYGRLKIEIEDIGGIDEIYKNIERLVCGIAQTLDLHATLDIVDNIGPAFEPLLGTDVRYREHFAHQFQVFLLGYYLINENDSLQEKLTSSLQSINHRNYNLEDALRVWFIASMFHDFSYSVGKMEDWLKKYFKRVEVPPKFQVNWTDIYTHYEAGKTNLVELISGKTNEAEDKIAGIIKDAFIKEYDHGVISALVLMNILHNKIEKDLLKEACCAIALHTEAVYSKFDKLKIDQFPFAFLLVFCDNAQQWGRPRMMTLIPDIEVKLKDIVTENGTKVEIKLKFQKLTPEQKRIIETNTTPPTKYWSSEKSLKFSIGLYEGDEEEAFRDYIFPFV